MQQSPPAECFTQTSTVRSTNPDVMGVKYHALKANAREFQKIEAAFQKTCNKKIIKIERIENLALWQPVTTGNFHTDNSTYVIAKSASSTENGNEKTRDGANFAAENQKIHGNSNLRWQSFAAKRRSLMLRGANKTSAYDKEITFHGCSPEVIPNIAQMGFNRSFCANKDQGKFSYV